MKSYIPRSETIALVAAELKKNSDATMDQLREVGKAEGHNVYPLIAGLARKELGLGNTAPAAERGPGRPKRDPSAVAPPARQRRARQTAAPALGSVSGFVEYVQSLEAEVRSLRAIVAKIGSLIQGR